MVCLLGILALSYFVLLQQSIRLDEAQSLWQTSHSLYGTLRVVAQDVHVPLYHIILHYWQVIFGQSIEVARGLSLLFFVASIPFVYALARQVLRTNWALFATILFSFSPFMNWYANEARMYTLLVLVTAASQYYFVKLVGSNGRRGWVGYSLVSMIGIYCHYFFWFNLVAQALYFLATRKHFARGTFMRFCLLAGLLVVEFLPWVFYFGSQGFAKNTSPNLPSPSSVDFVNVFSQFVFGFMNDRVNTILVSTWPLLVAVALLSVRYSQRVSSKVGYLVTASFLPVVLAYAISVTLTPFFLSRYMIGSVAPLLIVLVWLATYHSRYLKATSIMLALVVTGATSTQQYVSASTPLKEDYRSAANYATTHARSTDVIVLSAPFTVYPFHYYYRGTAAVTTLPYWDRTNKGPMPPFNAATLDTQVSVLKQSHQYVYLYLSNNQGYQEQIFQYFETRFENTVTQQYSPDLKLEVYRVGYSQLPPAGAL